MASFQVGFPSNVWNIIKGNKCGLFACVDEYKLGRSVSQIVTEVLKTTDLQKCETLIIVLFIGKKLMNYVDVVYFVMWQSFANHSNFIYALMYFIFFLILKIFKL